MTTPYDDMFQVADIIQANELKGTLEQYCKLSIFDAHRVEHELNRMCEEGDFVQENGEYKVFVP